VKKNILPFCTGLLVGLLSFYMFNLFSKIANNNESPDNSKLVTNDTNKIKDNTNNITHSSTTDASYSFQDTTLFNGTNALYSFFTKNEYNMRYKQIENSLYDYESFTDLILGKIQGVRHEGEVSNAVIDRISDTATVTILIKGKELKDLGSSMAWDTQHIGFGNWCHYLKGYVECVELKNKVLEYKLAILNKSRDTSDLKQDVYIFGKQMIDDYLDESKWAD
jgi:hypothetical protein